MSALSIVFDNSSQKETVRWPQNRTFATKRRESYYVQLSDTQILIAIREGDERVFEQVFRKYYGGLCTYGRSILRDEEESEEIVQNVFVGIWEKRAELEITQSLKSYLYRAVHNHCLNRIKHQKVRDEHQQYTLYSQEEAYESVSQTVYKNELESELAKAIGKLPEQCRVIFKLSRFEELRYQEIADQLGLSVKTVENQIGKALKILRTELADFLPVVAIVYWLTKNL
ncbi:RNA polymerase sigma-70 factor [Runella sp. SP2]|uniref:RNA polymerase sigma-70 factor n=1 Tax=Runella sp. SP2 TaxID=2268026 RepID=UPI00267DCA20|nr:RNA polymerase sigma-70 factor [Runella sp. SP2]